MLFSLPELLSTSFYSPLAFQTGDISKEVKKNYLFIYFLPFATVYSATQWYIFKRRILLPIWVLFLARILLLKVIYGLFEACILLLKVIYGLFGACILPWKYIRTQNWTQLAQSNIWYFKMYHWEVIIKKYFYILVI